MKWYYLIILAIILGACSPVSQETYEAKETKQATFAGGCFWCMEPAFENTPGVLNVVVGYTGGDEDDPTYEEVSRGETGHREAALVTYDPNKISYEELLDVFWRTIDPTDSEGQFADKGEHYKTAIYYHDDEQKEIAFASKQKLNDSGKFDKPVVTDIFPAKEFHLAENYHQDYYKKAPFRYNSYAELSGRKAFIRENWEQEEYKIPSQEKLKEILTKEQYRITQLNGTEFPFFNKYWNNTEDGIYVDIVSGEPLFSSTHKYKSGTGWPSFWQPLESANIVEVEDNSLFMKRTEVRSKHADSHLGHVFTDGPEPTGLRYCMNSAAMKFIPKEDLEKEGYGEYLYLFEE